MNSEASKIPKKLEWQRMPQSVGYVFAYVYVCICIYTYM